MEEPICVRYEWNPEAFAIALDAHQKQAVGTFGLWILRALLAVFAVVSIGLLLAIFLAPRQPAWSGGAPIILAAVFAYCWIIFYLAFWSKGIKLRVARKAFGNLHPDARFLEWVIAEDQLANRTALSTSTFLWPLFNKLVEAPRGFLLYQNTNLFYFLPDHGFSSAESIRRFADLARAKVPNYVVLGECQFPTKPEPIGLDEL